MKSPNPGPSTRWSGRSSGATTVTAIPRARSDAPIRIEHWVVAERQGQAAARNMLGAKERFADVPFFWSQHYDVPINYVGHAESLDQIDVRGSIPDRDCLIAYREGGRIAAVASIYRDRESLLAEVALERNDQAALEAILDGVHHASTA